MKLALLGALSIWAWGAGAQPSPPVKGSALNPDLSVNALMLERVSNRGNSPTSTEQNGISIQEAELQFFADVDPYSKLTALFSIHQESTSDSPWVIEPEELFAETLEVPRLTLRAGKFKAAFGRHNSLHTHAFPFIDAPLVNSVLFGGEGLNDVGISGAYLIPALWFSEATIQILSGRAGGTDYFNDPHPNQQVEVARFKNLWDLNEDLTAEFGLSGALGRNQFQDGSGEPQRGTSGFYGADLTLKWRPMVGGKYRAAVWTTEFIDRRIYRPSSANRGAGYASWLQYQFAERWWAEARSEYLNVRDDEDAAPLEIQPFQRKYSVLLAFFPSEFSGARLQYSYLIDGREEPEHAVNLQLNFTVGAHPAHAY